MTAKLTPMPSITHTVHNWPRTKLNSQVMHHQQGGELNSTEKCLQVTKCELNPVAANPKTPVAKLNKRIHRKRVKCQCKLTTTATKLNPLPKLPQPETPRPRTKLSKMEMQKERQVGELNCQKMGQDV